MNELLKAEARGILERFSKRVASQHGVSTMSPAVYDTAWVSMVSRSVDGITRWIFPECFEYLIREQLPEGGWQVDACDTDAILNTAAALWSLQEHRLNEKCQGCSLPTDIDQRIDRASQYLQQRLNTWEITENLPVGFEILLPTLLHTLEAKSLSFNFNSRRALEKLGEEKLSKFKPEILYSRHETTLLHSLEAFVGKIEYDKVRHHLKSGAMMNSPSSTAAYLMYVTEWDDEAEVYLRDTIMASAGQGNGGVPSAFPSTTFETSWVLSTLLEAKIDPDIANEESCHLLAAYLEKQLQAGGGISGFAPGVMPDADDSAKSLECLLLAGKSFGAQELIAQYEAKHHFRTYPGERDPSTSANCNILIALLYANDGCDYVDQITKAMAFLCEKWDEKALKDKWNTSLYYPIMRFSHAINLFLRQWERGRLRGIPDNLLRERIPVVATQMLRQLLQSQNTKGSWGKRSHPEEAAYGLQGLKALSSLPWFTAIQTQVEIAISKATGFLEQSMGSWGQGSYVWIEKVAYSSPELSQAYCVAALAYNPLSTWSEDVLELTAIQERTKEILGISKFFATLSKFSAEPFWTLVLSAIESFFYGPRLRSNQCRVFPEDGINHKHLQYIPFTWVATNNIAGHNRKLSSDQIWDMIAISQLNYQVDMYVETAIRGESESNVRSIEDFAKGLNPDIASNNPLKRRRVSESGSNGNATNGVKVSNGYQNGDVNRDSKHDTVEHIKYVLQRFVQHSLSHPSVLASPISTQNRLRLDLSKFLLAQISSNKDNEDFVQQGKRDSYGHHLRSSEPLFDWVRGRGALHTSCPYSFAFFSALVSPPGEELFPSEKTRYYANVVRQHLATACRLYNDYGSIKRDQLEGQLNTINWLQSHNTQDDNAADISTSKQEILDLAAFEDGIWKNALDRLEKVLGSERTAALKVFIDVTDLYGQLAQKTPQIRTTDHRRWSKLPRLTRVSTVDCKR